MGGLLITGKLAGAAIALALVLALPPGAGADWDYSQSATGSAVDAYTSEVSVLPGQTVHFHVSTEPAAPYRIEIYRLGTWQGRAPTRLTCLPGCRSSRNGRPGGTPAPDPSTGAIRANWPVTDDFQVPKSWPSGYYVGRVVLQSGAQQGKGKLVPFVVRETPGRKSTVVVVAAADTWQAYNAWGGKSLYFPRAAHAVKVSFDRPYMDFRVGGQSLFDWELPLTRFLEGQGYDVSYTTDYDVDHDPSAVLGHKLVIVAGHSEYWSASERSAFDSARAAGVNLMFAGANDGYWQVRWEDGGRTLVAYKGQTAPPYGADPQSGAHTETNTFRSSQVANPECQLIGIAFNGVVSTPPGFDQHVSNGSLGHPWFAGAGFSPDAVIPKTVGYEWDQVIPGCTPPLAAGTPLTVLFHTDAGGTDGQHPHDAVTYTAPSGARIFAAGSFEFPWGLDAYGLDATAGRQPPDARLQRFARNALRDLAGAPPHAIRSVRAPKKQSLRLATKRGIPLKVSLGIAGATVSVRILVRKGTHSTILGASRGSAGVTGGLDLKPKVGRRAARKLGGRNAVVTLSIALTAPGDAAETIQRKLTLTR